MTMITTNMTMVMMRTVLFCALLLKTTNGMKNGGSEGTVTNVFFDSASPGSTDMKKIKPTKEEGRPLLQQQQQQNRNYQLKNNT